MSRKANSTLIGGFVIGAIALVVIGVAYFGSGMFLAKKNTFVLYFQGSLAGLRVGAPVNFRGVKIGIVKDISVQYNTKDESIRIPVYIETQPQRVVEIGGDQKSPDPKALVHRLIDRGLRAQLAMQSFVTGQLEVTLDFFPKTPMKLVGADPSVTEIPTVPRPLEQLAKTIANLPLGDIVDNFQKTLAKIEELVSSPELADAIKSLDQSLKDFGKLARDIDEQVGPVAESFLATSKETREGVTRIADAVDDAKLTFNTAMKEFGQLSENVDGQVAPAVKSFQQAAQAATDMLNEAKKAMATFDSVISQNSELHYSIVSTMRDLSEAAESIKVLADYLEQHPEALIQGKSVPGGN